MGWYESAFGGTTSAESLLLSSWLTGKLNAGAFPSDWQWDHFAHLSTVSRVLPALHSDLANFSAVLELPSAISELIDFAHNANTERNVVAIDQAKQLAVALNEIGVLPVALKGLAYILLGIYPDLGSRYLADIDLLVAIDQLSISVGALELLGYAASDGHPVEFRIGHTYPAFTRHHSLEVDLHRTLGLSPCPSFLPASELLKDATLHKLGDASILLPSPTHLIMHHIMHSQMHDVYSERIAPSLRTLYDFYLLQRRFGTNIDWFAVKSHFEKKGYGETLTLYLLRVQRSLGLKPPFPLRLTPAIRLRRARRQFIQNYPTVRLFDPIYYWRAGIQPRTRRLREILSSPGGIHYLFQKLYKRSFYSRLQSDLRP